MKRKLTRKQKRELHDIETGIAALAMLTAGAYVLIEEFNFTHEQKEKWMDLTKAQSLVNAVIIRRTILDEGATTDNRVTVATWRRANHEQ